jgi:hypothetical protein
MREIKTIEYTCGLSAIIVGIGLYSYYVRELLASLAIFTGVFLVLGLVGLGAFLIWCAGEKVVTWSRAASRGVLSPAASSLHKRGPEL